MNVYDDFSSVCNWDQHVCKRAKYLDFPFLHYLCLAVVTNYPIISYCLRSWRLISLNTNSSFFPGWLYNPIMNLSLNSEVNRSPLCVCVFVCVDEWVRKRMQVKAWVCLHTFTHCPGVFALRAAANVSRAHVQPVRTNVCETSPRHFRHLFVVNSARTKTFTLH